MRIAMFAETFTPAVNGVVNSVRLVAAELTRAGHDVTVVAPSGESFTAGGGSDDGRDGVVRVVTVPSVGVPGYRGLRVARPGLDLLRTVHELRPDVVHLASPAVLGHAAGRAARALELPCVAVYQTDLAAFVVRHRASTALPAPARTRLADSTWQWLRTVHGYADITLAPSRASLAQLAAGGVGPLRLWPRGVDGELFHPARRDLPRRDALRNGRAMLVGVVARLAVEKRLHLLAETARRPDGALVVVGDGPERRRLELALPDTTFVGQLTGAELATTVASLDVLVHPGAAETFCQAVQEGLAAGVPAVVAAAGGPLDLVQDGRNGRLWRDDDPVTLADLVTSLRDPAARAPLAAAARSSVAHRTWRAVTADLLDTYADLHADRAHPIAA